MRKGEWLFALFMMAFGLGCLTVSATSLMERPFDSYVRTLLILCLWAGVPLLLIGIFYWFISRRHR